MRGHAAYLPTSPAPRHGGPETPPQKGGVPHRTVGGAWRHGRRDGRERQAESGLLAEGCLGPDAAHRQQYRYPACASRQAQYIAQLEAGERTPVEWGEDVDDRDMWEYTPMAARAPCAGAQQVD